MHSNMYNNDTWGCPGCSCCDAPRVCTLPAASPMACASTCPCRGSAPEPAQVSSSDDGED